MGEAGEANDRAACGYRRGDAGLAVFDSETSISRNCGTSCRFEIDIGSGLGARDILEGDDAIAEKMRARRCGRRPRRGGEGCWRQRSWAASSRKAWRECPVQP